MKAKVNFAEDDRIDAGTKNFLRVLNSGGAGLETMAVESARQVLIDSQANIAVDISGIVEGEVTITQDGYHLKLNIVRPEGSSEKLPVFIFIHGGGWVLGDYPTHKRLVRDLVIESGFVGIFVNYSLSPEAQYPQAVNEVYAATKWVSANSDKINVDGSKLALVGNSAGGNMAGVTALRAKLENGPKISLQILMWPVTDGAIDYSSFEEFGEDRFLTIPLMKWMFDKYAPVPSMRSEIYLSLINATTEQLKDLPPALIQVAENDILRDEGEAYGRKLDEAGVKVTTIRYNGMIHDFGLLNPLANLPTTRSLITHAAAELRKHLV
ncbi:alpha/beta hydrolase [Pedobacter antarcticus]|uniref:alpha/beta hydrolase n=1 Tax=Pedobacter antarcticus TaxID=34086 RepID=UPI00292EF72B|nr:alpha/beta hydrolase [Pedobacter antarcticus]